MKQLLYIICMLLCLLSCTDSKYRLQCKTIDNEVLADTIITVKELANGREAYARVEVLNINCVDTGYVFYCPAIHQIGATHYFNSLRTTKPINFISLTYIKD